MHPLPVVVEPPLLQPIVKIRGLLAYCGMELVEDHLLGTLNFAIELLSSGTIWSKLYSPFQKQILNFIDREFTTVVGLKVLNGKWHLLNYTVNEMNGIVGCLSRKKSNHEKA